MKRVAFFLVLIILASRMAHASQAYWQQHVAYKISVTLHDSIHTLDGRVAVAYTNNSPDTLHEIYFHLYSNAFQPGSLMDERAHQLHTNPIGDRISHLPKSEEGRYWIDKVLIDTTPTMFEITGTIMRVELRQPLKPGENVDFIIPFREQIPRQIRRNGWMSREGVEYSMAQWYPKVAEYDQEGWHRQEYVSHEFYGVWGDFTVEITLPARFTVGSSGECLNPAQVGHGYDRIANGEKRGYTPAVDGDQPITWKFHASPVHDFAWVADDDYVHEWSTWHDTVTLHAFYKSRYGSFWALKALEYTANSLQTYSDTFGPYPYRNFSTTMAGDGGMEYPQLIMITGYRPSPLSLAGVIAHEVGHQWFYGMLGSNETREAFMDEGFTSYATTIAMNAMYGDIQRVPGAPTSWLDWFKPEFSNKGGNYRGYQDIASLGYEEPLDIPHDWLREDATGGQVYGKTQAILNMLQYTLGDSVFGVGMKEYYTEWHFKHPHLVDFKKVMEKVAHTDLDWFFDEWFRSTRTVDYEAQRVHSKPVTNGFETTIKLRNNSLAVMPVDLLLHYEDGTTSTATIPLVTNKGLDYHKSGESLFFPGWDWVNPQYRGMTITPKRVSWFEIDTSWRLQDLNWLNNYSSRSGLWVPPGEWAVWKQLFLSPPIDKYFAVVRPIVWYDEPSKLNIGAGAKFGMNNSFSGDFKLLYKTDPLRGAEPPQWYDYVDGRLTYQTPVDWIGKLGRFGFDASKLDGIGDAQVSLSKMFRPTYFRLGADHTAKIFLERETHLDPFYPIQHAGWKAGTVNSAGIQYSVVTEGDREQFDLLGEMSLWKSDANYALFKVQYVVKFQPLWQLDARLRFTAGTSTDGALNSVDGTPLERRFSLSRANNYAEQQPTSGLYRAVTDLLSTYPRNMIGNAFVEGGAGVRGYNAGSSEQLAETGTNMLGGNFDLALPNPLEHLGNFAASFGFGLFTDAGWVGSDILKAWNDIRQNLRTDAGLKVSVNILSWLPSQLRGVAEEYAPIPVINFYWPVYENHPIDGTSPFAWRWAVSIGSAF